MRLSLGVRTSNGTISQAAWEMIADSTPGRFKLLELGIFLGAATASVFGIGIPGTQGVTPTSPVDFEPEDPNDVLASGTLQSAVSWGTSPTVPTKFFRRIALPAVIGSGVIWTFPKGLVLPVSESFVIWNITANAVADVYAVFDI